MLDEECLRPSPVTDEMFLLKLSYTFQENPYFESCGCKNFSVPHHYSKDLHESANAALVTINRLPILSFRLRHYTGSVSDNFLMSNFCQLFLLPLLLTFKGHLLGWRIY